MPDSENDSNGIEYSEIPNFHFSTTPSGMTYPIKLAYREWNKQNASENGGKGTVLIPTCYGGRVNSTQNFTEGALKDYHVVVVAMLGNGESTSPSNDPTGFFAGRSSKGLSVDGLGGLRYEDCINSQYELIKSLGVKELEAVIGFSMGGQQAYYWATLHGSDSTKFLKRAVVICGSARTSGHNIAFLEGPISALSQSIDYADGTYREKGIKPVRGLRAFGRAYAAWLTSPQWFREKKWEVWGANTLEGWLYPFEVEGKEAGFEGWDADDLLILAKMWQAGDIGSIIPSGDYIKALEGIKAQVLVMPSRTDQYFPPEDSEIEMKYLRHGILAPIETIWGHVAGGGANPHDLEWMDERIAEFIEKGT